MHEESKKLMRRLLLATSAVALATVTVEAPAAEAADWEIAVGGYFESYAAFAAPDVDGMVGADFDGVDSKSDPEVHFLPSITLDNGLQIGADVQLEGATDDFDQIDESYLFVDGASGRVLLGSADSAGYLMHYGAPDVTFANVNSGSMTVFVPFSGTAFGDLPDGALLIDTDEDGSPDASGLKVGDDVFNGTLGSTYLENRGNSDAQRFTYSRRASLGCSSASRMRATSSRTIRSS